MSRIVKVPATETGLCIKYGSNGRDLIVPAGVHYWEIDHGTWKDAYLTRREAREALRAFNAPCEHNPDSGQVMGCDSCASSSLY